MKEEEKNNCRHNPRKDHQKLFNFWPKVLGKFIRGSFHSPPKKKIYERIFIFGQCVGIHLSEHVEFKERVRGKNFENTRRKYSA